jgi:hypothetical protein
MHWKCFLIATLSTLFSSIKISVFFFSVLARLIFDLYISNHSHKEFSSEKMFKPRLIYTVTEPGFWTRGAHTLLLYTLSVLKKLPSFHFFLFDTSLLQPAPTNKKTKIFLNFNFHRDNDNRQNNKNLLVQFHHNSIILTIAREKNSVTSSKF